MNNKEKYQRTFSALNPTTDYLEKIVETEDSELKERKRVSLPKLLAACITIIVVLAAMSAIAYATDIGGIQRIIQIWTQGELTDAELNITTDGKSSEYTISYTDENGEEHVSEGGGVAIGLFGKERPLTEEEIIEHLNEPQLMVDDDGKVMIYCRDQELDITDKFDAGVCYVKLTVDGKPLYITVAVDGEGYSMAISPKSYPKG